MTGRYLLDTNIIIALFKKDQKIIDRLEVEPETFVSVITIGELFFGAYRSRRVSENVARVSELVKTAAILGSDPETARHYGIVKERLLAIGKPIPENDIWIAATAKRQELTLVTRDSDFDEVEGLPIQVW